jgi:CheY-like chemotaxis protein
MPSAPTSVSVSRPRDIVIRSEIADRAQVRLSTLVCWMTCSPDFPLPCGENDAEPVWSWSEVAVWLEATGRLQVHSGQDAGPLPAPIQVHRAPPGVLIVDGHVATRSALAMVLAQHEVVVVGEAGSASEGVTEALRLRPDLVLMDLRLPDGSGADACQQIRAVAPEIRVIMLTLYDDPGGRRAALDAGAEAFLVKTGDTTDLYQALGVPA